MNKTLWTLLFLSTILLEARNNPFSPIIPVDEITESKQSVVIPDSNTTLESIDTQGATKSVQPQELIPKVEPKKVEVKPQSEISSIIKQKPVEIIKIIPAVTKPIKTTSTQTPVKAVIKTKKVVQVKKIKKIKNLLSRKA